MSDNSKAEAKERLLEALPHLRFAASEAQLEGTVQLGILAVKEDGTGNIKARFDAAGFFEDLALVIDAPPQTEDDIIDAKAVKLLQQLGLK